MKRRLSFALGLIASAVALPMLTSTPAVASLAEVGAAVAQNVAQPKVKLVLGAQKRVKATDAQGQESVRWQDLEGRVEVQPGDVIRYTLNSQNGGKKSATNLVLTQPIPSKTQYIANTARANGAELTYSIDSGKTFSVKPMIEVKLPNGTVELQPAPASLYSHIRWNYGNSLKPMASVRAVYEVSVK